MSTLLWYKLFKLPQTQVLLLGTILGYACLLVILRLRPLPILAGGLISVVTIGAWAFEARKGLLWMEDNLLEPGVFQSRLRMIEKKVQNNATTLWQQVRIWACDVREFADRIREREPYLTPELLETLYTTLVLVEQLANKLAATRHVRTDTYREIAQQQIQAHYHRLQITHDQLQGLHDQIVLLAPDREIQNHDTTIPAQLRLLIEANRITLQGKMRQGS